jgi:hypothetical protein
VGEVEVAVQLGAGPDLPDLQPAVRLIDRLVYRGGNPPGGGRRCRRGVSAGCP